MLARACNGFLPAYGNINNKSTRKVLRAKGGRSG